MCPESFVVKITVWTRVFLLHVTGLLEKRRITTRIGCLSKGSAGFETGLYGANQTVGLEFQLGL